MNPYQKIIIDGKEIQKGHIDTHLKYSQLMDGIDIKNKSVLDVGCNLGEMTRLARLNGASYVVGIDSEYEYIKEATEIDPNGLYCCKQATEISGKYDIIIASAMFHYIKEHDKFINQLARVGDIITMDVWIAEGDENAFYFTDRKLYIPTRRAFESIASRYFKKIEMRGNAISPDNSNRLLYRLSDSNPIPAKAVLIYGQGSMGKSTYAKALGYKHFQFDDIFLLWKMHRKNLEYSVTNLVDSIINHDILKNSYFELHKTNIENWIKSNQNNDIVLEGYDPVNEEYKNMVIELLKKYGWNDIEIINANKPLWLK